VSAVRGRRYLRNYLVVNVEIVDTVPAVRKTLVCTGEVDGGRRFARSVV
jgi:hypothetical protein